MFRVKDLVRRFFYAFVGTYVNGLRDSAPAMSDAVGVTNGDQGSQYDSAPDDPQALPWGRPPARHQQPYEILCSLAGCLLRLHPTFLPPFERSLDHRTD